MKIHVPTRVFSNKHIFHKLSLILYPRATIVSKLTLTIFIQDDFLFRQITQIGQIEFNTTKFLVHLFERETLRLDPVKDDKQDKEDIPASIDDISLPPNGGKEEGEDPGDKHATGLGEEGKDTHAGAAHAVGEDFRGVHDGQRGEAEGVGAEEEEDAGDGAVDAGMIVRGAVDLCEAAWRGKKEKRLDSCIYIGRQKGGKRESDLYVPRMKRKTVAALVLPAASTLRPIFSA